MVQVSRPFNPCNMLDSIITAKVIWIRLYVHKLPLGLDTGQNKAVYDLNWLQSGDLV